MKRKKNGILTERDAQALSKLADAGLNDKEISTLTSWGESTIHKLRIQGFDLGRYRAYNESSFKKLTTTPTVDILPLLVNIDKNLEILVKQRNKKKGTVSEYNAFVAECYKNNPDTNLKEIVRMWRAK